MAWVATAVIGGSLISGYMGAEAQEDAANAASAAQISSANSGIAEQRRQFDMVRELLAPYTSAGETALMKQLGWLGLNGSGEQQALIDELQGGAEFRTLLGQGEDAILQNASATGGLRGGNTQRALMEFRPNLLNQLIQQRYDRLGGLTSIGQNAAVGTGNAGMQTGQAVSGLLQQQGAAVAGNAMAQGAAQAGMWNQIGQLPAQLATMKALKVF